MLIVHNQLVPFIICWADGRSYGLRNRWFTSSQMEVYVRSAYRLHVRGIVSTIEIANVGVVSRSRGTGIFTKFLEEMEAAVTAGKFKVDALYVENVHDERFQKFFERRGYERADVGESVCFLWFPRSSDGAQTNTKHTEATAGLRSE